MPVGGYRSDAGPARAERSPHRQTPRAHCVADDAAKGANAAEPASRSRARLTYSGPNTDATRGPADDPALQ